MKNFLKRCWQRRWFRRLAWSMITLTTLCLLLFTWLNWSWSREWSEAAKRLESEGETLDLRLLVNDPVPETENFCAIPLLIDLADPGKGEPAINRKRLDATKLPDGKGCPNLPNPGLGKAADLNAWASWLRKNGSLPMPVDSGNAARDLLTGLAEHDPIVQELAAGLQRPQAQWTPEWKTRELPQCLMAMQVPHYMPTRNLGRTLALRATASARAGEAQQAHEGTLIMTRLAQANMGDPVVIGLLVAASNVSAISGTTWELCDAQAGTAEDFARLEAALVALDFHRASLRAFRGEMVAAVNTMEFLKRRPSDMVGLTSFDGEATAEAAPIGIAMRAIPSSFFDASAAVLVDCQFRHLIKPLRDRGWKESLDASKDYERELIEMKRGALSHPTHALTALMAPAMTAIVPKAIYAQALVDQAVIACALERHRIESGGYPESLEGLKLVDGRPLPLDVMNGKPLGYRRTADGRYMLWSVGFDGEDGGGKRLLDKAQPEKTRFSDAGYAGDWVWDFAGTP